MRSSQPTRLQTDWLDAHEDLNDIDALSRNLEYDKQNGARVAKGILYAIAIEAAVALVIWAFVFNARW